jgi:hypothetical protein
MRQADTPSVEVPMERTPASDSFRRHFYPVMSAVIFGVVAALVHLAIDKTAAQWPQLILPAVGFGVLFGIGFMVFRLFGSMDRLFSTMEDLTSIAPRLTYYSVQGKLGQAVLYEEAKKIIANAKREILLLNWSAEETFEEGVRTSRDEYFDDLVVASEHVTYSRVLQSRSYWRNAGAKSIGDTFEESYVRHFRKILAAQVTQRSHDRRETEIVVVPPSIPSTFLIADDNYLIWQLNEVREPKQEGMQWQIRGAIVIHDPGGEIIKQFRATFKRAKGDKPRPLEEADLLKTGRTDDET